MNDQEPYKATKLWNEIIQTFRSEMPRGRHRRRVRQYENCFVATDAVSWLQLYLKSNHNFGPDVTRFQAIQLLRKFQKSGVFEDVRGPKNSRACFEDDNRLYVFLYQSPKKSKGGIRSPLKVVRPPLMSLENNRTSVGGTMRKPSFKIKTEIPNPAQRLFRKSSVKDKFELRGNFKAVSENDKMEESHLTIYDVQDIWFESILDRLQNLLKIPSIKDIIDISKINPRHLIHNSYRVGKSGVVTLVDRTEDLPHWVMSAMKCLVNWPNASGSGSCLPRYEGFENDVFKVLVDYFNGMKNPMISHALYHLFISIFVRSEFLHNQENLPKSSSFDFNTIVKRKGISKESVQKLMTTLDNPKHFQSTPLVDYSDGSEYMHYNMVPVLNCTPVIKTCVNCELPPNSCYETAFEYETPVTRIITDHKFSYDGSNDHSPPYIDMSSKQCIRKLSDLNKKSTTLASSDDFNIEYVDMTPSSNIQIGPLNNSLTRSVSTDNVFVPSFTRLHEFKRRSERRSRSPSDGHKQFATVRKIKRGYEQKRNSQRAKNNFQEKMDSCESCGYINLGFQNLSAEDVENVPCDNTNNSLYYSAKSFLDNSCNASLDIRNGSRIRGQSSDFQFDVSTSPSMDNLSTLGSPVFPSSEAVSDLILEAMQLSCLFLPPVNRRHLHLLLRVINKMSVNTELQLDADISIQEITLKKFSKCILCPEDNVEFDEVLNSRIISLLLNNCEAIFKPHENLKMEVEAKLKKCKKRQKRIDEPLTFCDKISVREFETQKHSIPVTALANLLDNIVTNEKLSDKEKLKKLQLFKETYPEVFNLKFPNGYETELQKPKLKTSKSQLLTRLKSIRI